MTEELRELGRSLFLRLHNTAHIRFGWGEPESLPFDQRGCHWDMMDEVMDVTHPATFGVLFDQLHDICSIIEMSDDCEDIPDGCRVKVQVPTGLPPRLDFSAVGATPGEACARVLLDILNSPMTFDN